MNKTEEGRGEITYFLQHAVKSALSRNGLTILKAPTHQHYFFFPFKLHDAKLVFGAGAFYSSDEDYENFLTAYREKYHITEEDAETWHALLPFKDYYHIKSTAENFELLMNEFITLKFSRHECKAEQNLIKTIFGLMAEIRDISEVYKVIIDFTLMLMGLDTVSYHEYNEELRRTPMKIAAGIYSEKVKDVNVPVSGIIERAVNTGQVRFTDESREIFRLGFGEGIHSLYAFPVHYNNKILGIMNVYNSHVSANRMEILTMFSKVIGSMIYTIELKNNYEQKLKLISDFSASTSVLDPTRKQEDLFRSIVENAANIVKADRVSLMLLDNEILRLKAAKGIDQHIAAGIRVKIGEPVAGKVFAEGEPLIIRDAVNELPWNGKFGSTYRTRSFISIPLIIRNKAVGVLNAADKNAGTIFSHEDFQILQSFAAHATVVLESSNYYQLSEEMRELSITDSLTNLFNRRYFNERFEEEIQRSLRHDFKFALIFADIDNFKEFNDSEGHLKGDSLLKAIADIIRESTRGMDIPARFGGEEFAIILPQTDGKGAYQIAERIRNNIKDFCPRFWKNFPKNCITVSLGVSVFPDHGTYSHDLIKNADKALYRAKRLGKNRTVSA